MIRAPIAAVVVLAVAGCAEPKPRESAASPPIFLSAVPNAFFEPEPGIRLRYRQAGVGEPVLLLHGLAGSLEAIMPLADSLGPDYRIIALDQRGHGQSSVPPADSAYGRAMGEDVIRLLDHLEIARVHLVGHPMGAVVSAYVAARHPDRVATASLIAAPFFEDSATAARALAPVVAELEAGGGFRAFLKRFAPELPDTLAAAVSTEMVATSDRTMLSGILRRFPDLSVGREGVSTARTPAVIVVGSIDTLRVEDRALAGWWPEARLVEVAGADHVNILWHPATLAAIRERINSPRRR
jgi:pimeloyl-ACP methyl ester carboxylesterase